MAAETAVTTIHTAETQYYSEHGRYAATLEQLGLDAAALTGGNTTIVLRPDAGGLFRNGKSHVSWKAPALFGSKRAGAGPMIPRPLNMEQLVRCLEKQYGPVSLFPDEGYTKLRVAGVAVTFLEAEKLCLGETSIDDLRGSAS